MRIALIAMSGIRCCDAGLMRLGLTLPGFVERGRTIASLPSLGLLTLVGMTPPEHELVYFEVRDLPEIEPLPAGFDLVAISSLSAQIGEAYELARRFAGCGVPVVMGGLHVTSVPDEAARHGASACVGEGEVVWPQVLQDADAGRLRPVYDARGRDFDLADAPMPRYELLDLSRYNRLTVQTSRGCPWRCSFCGASVLLTDKYKQKPIANVLAEVDRIQSLWQRPFIELADDNTFVNLSYWIQLLPQLAERQLRWFAETDVSVHEDDQLLRLMRKAGCAEVLIGLESPRADDLDQLELKRNWKHRQWPYYQHAIETIQSHGIRVNACFMLGLDGQTTDVFEHVRDFVEHTAPYDVQITVATPFPKTPFYEQLKSEGRLLDESAWHRCTLFDVNYCPNPMSVAQLRQGLHALASDLYSEESTNRRRERFKRQATHGRRQHKETYS